MPRRWIRSVKTAGLFSRGMKVFLPGWAVSGGSGLWVLRIWGLGEPSALMYTPGVGASSIAVSTLTIWEIALRFKKSQYPVFSKQGRSSCAIACYLPALPQSLRRAKPPKPVRASSALPLRASIYALPIRVSVYYLL